MATRDEYKAQGYTDAQIDAAIANKELGNAPMNAAPAAPAPATSAVTPTPAVPAAEPQVTRDEAYANAVEASKRTDAEGVTTPTPVTPATQVSAPAQPPATAAIPVTASSQPPAVPTPAPKPTDYVLNPQSGKYEAKAGAKPEVPKVETPKPVKTEPTVDFNVSAGRETEIQKNLNDISSGNPALLADRAKFDQAFGYSTADAGKKALLDSFFESKRAKPDSDSIFAQIIAGTPIQESLKTSNEYLKAKKRADLVKAAANYSVGQFSSALKNGKILKGSRLYDDLMKNPASAEKLAKAESLNRINSEPTKEESVKESVMGEIKATTFGKAVEDGQISAEEADALLSNDEIKTAKSRIEPLKNKYDQLKADYDNIETDTKNEFEGKGASRSYINAKISERRKNAYRDLEVASSEYNNALGALADLKKEQADVLSMNMKLYETEQAFARQKEMAQFQSDLSVSAEQKKFEQKIAQQAAAAKDPVLATQQMLDSYAEMGIIPQRSASEIVAQVQAEVKAGKPLGQVLTELNKAFQSKSEYKAAIEKKFPSEGTPWKLVSVTVDGQTKSMERNEKTGEMREIGTAATSTGVPAVTTGETGGTDAESLVKKWEGFRDQAYQDSAGVWTIGYGFTNVNGKPVKEGDVMSRRDADAMFSEKLNNYTNYKNFIKVPLSSSQNAALNSFEYNLGQGIWQKSAMGIIDKINSGDLEGAAKEMRKYVYAGGKPVQGLINRRNDEAELIKKEVPKFAQNFLGALQRGEFTTSGGKAETREYTATEAATMDKFLKDTGDKETNRKMKEYGLTENDANEYAKKKSAGVSEVEKLSDNARIEIGKAKSSFQSNPMVKSFEETLSANRDLVSSLNSELKGPGDVAAIFQFMKSLDPNSVVRESEFELAASTAGYAGNAKKFLENLSNPNDKSWLVPETREAFRKLASKYVENKAKTYDRLYDDMERTSKAWGAPQVLIPTRASDEIRITGKNKTFDIKNFE